MALPVTDTVDPDGNDTVLLNGQNTKSCESDGSSSDTAIVSDGEDNADADKCEITEFGGKVLFEIHRGHFYYSDNPEVGTDINDATIMKSSVPVNQKEENSTHGEQFIQAQIENGLHRKPVTESSDYGKYTYVPPNCWDVQSSPSPRSNTDEDKIENVGVGSGMGSSNAMVQGGIVNLKTGHSELITFGKMHGELGHLHSVSFDSLLSNDNLSHLSLFSPEPHSNNTANNDSQGGDSVTAGKESDSGIDTSECNFNLYRLSETQSATSTSVQHSAPSGHKPDQNMDRCITISASTLNAISSTVQY